MFSHVLTFSRGSSQLDCGELCWGCGAGALKTQQWLLQTHLSDPPASTPKREAAAVLPLTLKQVTSLLAVATSNGEGGRVEAFLR